MGFPLKLRSMT